MSKLSVNRMKRAKISVVSAMALLIVSACGGEQDKEAVVADEPNQAQATAQVSPKLQKRDDVYDGTISKPGAPYSISYRIVGTPVVGSPVTVDLRVASTRGPQPVNLSYRIIDSSALLMAESQPNGVRLEPVANEDTFRQQVTVVPQREGRFYLNVSAALETDAGTNSTVIAIPIQVGGGARELTQNGEEQLDENGEAVRVLRNGDD